MVKSRARQRNRVRQLIAIVAPNAGRLSGTKVVGNSTLGAADFNGIDIWNDKGAGRVVSLPPVRATEAADQAGEHTYGVRHAQCRR